MKVHILTPDTGAKTIEIGASMSDVYRIQGEPIGVDLRDNRDAYETIWSFAGSDTLLTESSVTFSGTTGLVTGWNNAAEDLVLEGSDPLLTATATPEP